MPDAKSRARIRDLLAQIQDEALREELTRLLERTGDVPSKANEFQQQLADLIGQITASHAMHLERMAADIYLPTATNPKRLAFNINLPKLPPAPWDHLPLQPVTQPTGQLFHHDYLARTEPDDK